ncbi:MAG: alpha-E domain-containing protein [Chromatiales bacterium]|nr:alpha-E domain-containing protein [Chromatiales bacterium]
MLSRVAANLYWFGRYTERTEDTARLIRVNTQLLLDLPKGISPGWRPLLEIMGARDAFDARYQDSTERNALRFLIGEPTNSSSILSSVRAARENVRTMRDYLPRETWEQVNELYLYARDKLPDGLSKHGRHEYLDQIIKQVQGIAGLLGGAMSHDRGFVFLRSGRHIERADMTSRIIDVRSASLLSNAPSEIKSYDNVQWMSVLKSLTAYQMYRRTMQSRVQRSAVLAFLLKDPSFPRAINYSLAAVAGGLDRLPHNEAPLREVGRARRLVDAADVHKLSQEELHRFIDEFQIALGDVHNAIAATYFDVPFDPPAPPEPAAQSQEQTQTAAAPAA